MVKIYVSEKYIRNRVKWMESAIEVTVQELKTRKKEDKKGWYISYSIVLPKQLCQALGITKGSILTVSLENEALCLRKKHSS